MCQKDLVQVLKALPKFEDPNLIFGYDALGDAGVYALDKHNAIVQTVDVLTPIADDPYTFGEIAAANSMSDVYAMGGKPICALNIIGFPPKLDISILEEIVRGGSNKVKEAGAVVLGGHTIKDEELKYGLAVTGRVRRDRLVRNDGARPGDRLVLTKPLGTGVISTALKAGVASEEAVSKINKSMRELNEKAAEAMVELGASACTDVTGFGLLGHTLQMAQASKVGMRIWVEEVPIFEEAFEYARKGLFPGGSKANYDYAKAHLDWRPSVSEETRMLLSDAQTSGGLLISLASEKTEPFLARMKEEEVREARVIGEVTESKKPKIYLE